MLPSGSSRSDRLGRTFRREPDLREAGGVEHVGAGRLCVHLGAVLVGEVRLLVPERAGGDGHLEPRLGGRRSVEVAVTRKLPAAK